MATTDFKDYYQILGVSKSASTDDIKRAFRKLARKYHPDVNPGDQVAEAKFKEINEANEILSDSEKRRKYDQFGRYWQQGGQTRPNPTPGDFGGFDFSNYGSFNELLNELLGGLGGGGFPGGGRTSYRQSTGPGAPGFGFDPTGGGSAPGNSAPGNSTQFDQEASITLTMADAFNGTQKKFRIGSDALTVKIPAGVKPGSKIRLRGKGQMNPYSQQRGDIYLTVEVQAHPFFKFDGDSNLVCEVPISPDEAVLGAKIEVPTPDGSVNVNIPAGIRSGQTLRLRGKGWPKPKENRTDQLVTVIIKAPKTVTDKERALYEQLNSIRSYDPRQEVNSVKL
ncbi:J domain-containing protein [Leptothoe sp. PORK10 BA2]|uniref:J domain-containing protein n=1 Tax=Leptothoe sp. PORK10 BA2 TaxID=3110254 RepID=UPI002B21B3F7|nr:J domain-containing protein [Leptothoe sp. PORK10 BA2]MEA5464247.1 J domain-containing protein [Leptothoe sp. PORK10 BA2]